MNRWLLSLAAIFLSFAWSATAEPGIPGLDHIPLVVRDLDRAAVDFSALGFVLKPSRPHANGLRNVHAKFPDGTEVELISPGAPTDELSRRYVDWLRQGDGPVSLGLFALQPPPASLPGIFFDKRQTSPTDRPEHFAHPNGASTLAAVWLAGSPVERQLVELTGGRPVDRSICAPFGKAARVLSLPEGEIMLLPRLSDRPIVGATVTVASIEAARRFVPYSAIDCPRGLWVETHGLWLEFRER